jgi:hypothetical protein
VTVDEGKASVGIPSDNPVYESIARSLADLQQPDLSGFPEEQVREVTNEMFGESGIQSDCLDRLRDRIHELSHGMTRLEDADKDDFLFLSKEWGAVYQRLVGMFTERLVIIGRSKPQFLFVPHK